MFFFFLEMIKHMLTSISCKKKIVKGWRGFFDCMITGNGNALQTHVCTAIALNGKKNSNKNSIIYIYIY